MGVESWTHDKKFLVCFFVVFPCLNVHSANSRGNVIELLPRVSHEDAALWLHFVVQVALVFFFLSCFHDSSVHSSK